MALIIFRSILLSHIKKRAEKKHDAAHNKNHP